VLITLDDRLELDANNFDEFRSTIAASLARGVTTANAANPNHS